MSAPMFSLEADTLTSYYENELGDDLALDVDDLESRGHDETADAIAALVDNAMDSEAVGAPEGVTVFARAVDGPWKVESVLVEVRFDVGDEPQALQVSTLSVHPRDLVVRGATDRDTALCTIRRVLEHAEHTVKLAGEQAERIAALTR